MCGEGANKASVQGARTVCMSKVSTEGRRIDILSKLGRRRATPRIGLARQATEVRTSNDVGARWRRPPLD